MSRRSDDAIKVAKLERQVHYLMHQNQADEALSLVDKMISEGDGGMDVQLLRGEALMQLHRFEDALKTFEQSHHLDPTDARILAHKGAALMRLQRVEEALAAFDKGTKLAPEAYGGWYNRGFAHAHLNRLDDAIADFDKALEFAPDSGAALVNRAMALLRLGYYREGFAQFEARFMIEPGIRELRTYRQQRWRKGNAIEGKRILLYAEQGVGDVIQFVRFVPQVAARAAHVTLEVQLSLVRLLKMLPCEVVAAGTQSTSFNLHCPLVSLGTVLDVQLDTIPTQVPYLKAPAEDSDRWRQKLASAHGDKLKVGLAWAGNPQHMNDYNRSLNFEQLMPLLKVPGVAFVSLQKGLRDAEAAAVRSVGILDQSSELGDFADTAGLIESLDIVISADTAVAHLAGALGKETWILVPFASDWRWMLERSDSPWYPSAHLFRQKTIGDWSMPIEAARQKLSLFAAGQTPDRAP